MPKLRKHGVWCLVEALILSGSLTAMLTVVDSNGFDWRKDIPKILLAGIGPILTWARMHTHDEDEGE